MMEFYKEYIDDSYGWTTFKLNQDVKNNPQWKSEIKGYTKAGNYTYILVRWVGLSETPFKESE